MKHIWIPLLLIAVTGQANAQDRPNVVIMLADNVGYGDIGAYGAGEVRGMPTPRIDQLASQGLQLTQFLVEPGCTPSRAALMTGRYSPRAGLSTMPNSDTPYSMVQGDLRAEPLDGSKHKYTLTFPAGDLPPVNAFWSITIYDAKAQLLIQNPIDCYFINSPMLPTLQKNKAGSLAIYIQKHLPGKDNESNGLAAPDGLIFLVMRLY